MNCARIHYSLHIIQSIVVPTASEATRIVIKYQLCQPVCKTNSCVFNCKLNKKQKSRKFMTLVKKVHFLWLFIAIKKLEFS